MKKNLSLLILNYLRLLAKIQLLKNKPLIIGITGSAGKTSTRNAVEAILKDHFKIKVSYKANSESGLPLNILGLSLNNYSWLDWLKVILLAPIKLLTNWEKYEIYIAEMAIDSPHSPKNMSYLLSIFHPKIGIFLNAQPLHSYSFDNLIISSDPKERAEEVKKLIANEKGKLIEALPKNGWAILNQDDKNIYRFKELTQAQTVSFGQKKQAEVHYTVTSQSLVGTTFRINYLGKSKEITFNHYVLPNHYGYSFCAAIACSLKLGLNLKQAANSLQNNFKLPAGRSSLIKSINNSYIIDSSYNSSSTPLIDSLNLLSKIAPKRKLALLGDMRELGQETQTEHEKIAQSIKNNCDLVILIGPQMKQFVLPILKQTQLEVFWFEKVNQALPVLKKTLQPNDVLLVKGSQNELFLEYVVEKLMIEKEKADSLLCRRGKYWQTQRKKWFG